jgi:hypothetical protein
MIIKAMFLFLLLLLSPVRLPWGAIWSDKNLIAEITVITTGLTGLAGYQYGKAKECSKNNTPEQTN